MGGITRHPDWCWKEQVARNATIQDTGYLNDCRYVLHDRDKRFCREVRETLAASGVKCTPFAARSPNLNAHAERWVRSIKEECLSKLILFGERSLRRVVSDFLEHYHQERNHQGQDNLLLFPVSAPRTLGPQGAVRCRERLVAYSNTTAAPHEYFDQTPFQRSSRSSTRIPASRITRPITLPRSAPSAMGKAISLRRCATMYEINPSTPSVASRPASRAKALESVAVSPVAQQRVFDPLRQYAELNADFGIDLGDRRLNICH